MPLSGARTGTKKRHQAVTHGHGVRRRPCGGVIGPLFLVPLLGAAVRARPGPLVPATDTGINDYFMKERARTFSPVPLRCSSW